MLKHFISCLQKFLLGSTQPQLFKPLPVEGKPSVHLTQQLAS